MRYPSSLSGGGIIAFTARPLSQEHVNDNAFIFKQKANSLWLISTKDNLIKLLFTEDYAPLIDNQSVRIKTLNVNKLKVWLWFKQNEDK